MQKCVVPTVSYYDPTRRSCSNIEQQFLPITPANPRHSIVSLAIHKKNDEQRRYANRIEKKITKSVQNLLLCLVTVFEKRESEVCPQNNILSTFSLVWDCQRSYDKDGQRVRLHIFLSTFSILSLKIETWSLLSNNFPFIWCNIFNNCFAAKML